METILVNNHKSNHTLSEEAMQVLEDEILEQGSFTSHQFNNLMSNDVVR